jgi:hypothetical protein
MVDPLILTFMMTQFYLFVLSVYYVCRINDCWIAEKKGKYIHQTQGHRNNNTCQCDFL